MLFTRQKIEIEVSINIKVIIEIKTTILSQVEDNNVLVCIKSINNKIYKEDYQFRQNYFVSFRSGKYQNPNITT